MDANLDRLIQTIRSAADSAAEHPPDCEAARADADHLESEPQSLDTPPENPYHVRGRRRGMEDVWQKLDL